MESKHQKVTIMSSRAFVLVAASLFVLLALWLVLAPAEEQLGNLIKLVYLHGALVWAGMGAFSAAGLLGLLALLTVILCRN